MAEVEVIKAVDGPILRKRDYEGNPVVITRQRVAAYVRVSTDGDEQLESFQSQKQYYQDKISENRDWVMVGIYADEAITGTKVDKREQFQRMIQDCMDGKIDVIMTKSDINSHEQNSTYSVFMHVCEAWQPLLSLQIYSNNQLQMV